MTSSSSMGVGEGLGRADCCACAGAQITNRNKRQASFRGAKIIVYYPFKSRCNSQIAYKICVTSARKLLFSPFTAEYQKLRSPFCEIKDKNSHPVPVRT